MKNHLSKNQPATKSLVRHLTEASAQAPVRSESAQLVWEALFLFDCLEASADLSAAVEPKAAESLRASKLGKIDSR